ncbi:MAG: NAD(P)(+) transhydrogenase [Phycisphaerae bacterium]|nr:putative soluble pyridine nucleotide transhydrogenase [Phycisphaerales bacterium]MCK6477477.1 Si-specific NAD(P)(+) transhydrogenase [Phycisphaerales bacterium]
MRHFDLCVIGSGAGGQRAAIQAAKLGKKVCVVEKAEVVGGAAVNTGTIPSKALREAILHAAGCRVAIPGSAEFMKARGIDMPHLMNACQAVILAEIELLRGHFASNDIQVITGRGQFRDATTIDVIGEHATETVSADFTVIAVGTCPSRPSDVPFDGVNVISSDELLHLKVLPKSMLVVGGGVIGTEYASMLSAIGVKTTLIEGRPKLLEFIDTEIVEAFQYHARRGGLTLRLGEKVVRIGLTEAPQGARSTDGIMVEAMLESGKILRADALLYCIGRQGATNGLCLENAGLSADSRGRIDVNERYQTKVPNIYAVGDVIGFPALASTSMEQGRLAACYMFGLRCERIDDLLPYGIYAIPEISMVGWTEERLTAAGIPYEAGVAHYREIARGQLLGDDIGMLKMLIHQETHTVLGVHTIGTGATELIHIGQAAIAFKATADYFVNTVFNYPTLAECYKVAALNGLNKIRSI